MIFGDAGRKPFLMAVLVNCLFSSLTVILSPAGFYPALGAAAAGFLLTAGLILLGVRRVDRSARGILTGLEDREPENSRGPALRDLSRRIRSLTGRIQNDNVAVKNLWRKEYELGQDIYSSSDSILQGIKAISGSAESLETTSGKLDENIGGSKQRIDEIQTALGRARSAFANQVSAVEESSASIEELISSIRNMAAISESKREALNRLSVLAEQGRGEIGKTLASFSSIGKTTQLMMDMIKVIGDIAERTNLLSMNAAIEAAHAGDRGRGFAVVADEVRKLAESSRMNADTISATLRGISADIGKTAESSALLKENINRILDQVNEAADSMGEIIGGMTEMSVGTAQISTALSTLAATSAEAKQYTDEISENSLVLQSNMKDVENHSGENLVRTRQITGEVHRITGSLSLLFDICEDNSRNLTQMRHRLDATGTEKRFVGDYIPPYQFVEGDRVTGVFTDVVRLMTRTLGVEDPIEFLPWDKAYQLAHDEPGVFMMTTLRTPQREKEFRWIGPVVPDTHYLYRLSERSDIRVLAAGDLKNYRLGCVTNNYAYKFFLDSGVPESGILTTDTQSMNIQNLLLGKVDLIPMSALQVAYQLKIMKRPPDTVTTAFAFTGFPTDAYMAASLSTPDDLYGRYAEAFEKVRKTPEYRTLLARYSG